MPTIELLFHTSTTYLYLYIHYYTHTNFFALTWPALCLVVNPTIKVKLDSPPHSTSRKIKNCVKNGSEQSQDPKLTTRITSN